VLGESGFTASWPELLNHSLTALKTLMRTPTPEEAAALSQYEMSHDQNERKKQLVAGALGVRDVLTSRFFFPPRPYDKTFMWREGSLALSSRLVRNAFSLREGLKKKLSGT